MNAVEDLVEQRLDHSFVDHNLLLVGLGSPVEFDDVPEIMFRVVDEQQHFPIRV